MGSDCSGGIFGAHFRQDETFSSKLVIGLVVWKLLKGVALVFRRFHFLDSGYPGGNPEDPDWIFAFRMNFFRLCSNMLLKLHELSCKISSETLVANSH